MLEINLSINPHFGYKNQFVTLNGKAHKVSLELKDGTHIAKSSDFELGVLNAYENRPLLGHLTFKYSYDEESHVVTVCGTNFESTDAMCLSTVPKGTTEYCHQWASSSGFAADDVMANPHWNYCTPLFPGLEDVLKGIVRSTNEQLITALEKIPGLIVQVRKHPPALSAEDYHNLLTVYRDGKFHGFYDEGAEYGANDVVHTIESTFGGEVTFNYGEAFANVIGSDSDPKVAGMTWIRLWAGQFGFYPTICTSYHFNNFPCGNTLYGGHVVTGQVAKKMPKGSNAVYIMPICIQHNNDNSVYMEALQYQKGIWLKNYLGP